MKQAAVYARMSSDDGSAKGVGRQIEDCLQLAEKEGWTVAEVYVDNDVSASSGKKRPEYERMLADIRDGFRDGVIVYHADRLHRRPIELEQFVDVAIKAGISQVRFATGVDFDMGDGDGLLMMRMMGAMAAAESATKSRRIKRKTLEIALTGAPGAGAGITRPFGYELDLVTVRESEAKLIRAMVDRYIAGESTYSLATWLTNEKIPTATGLTRWTNGTVAQIVRSHRIAGLRAHLGVVVATATWPAIISRAKYDRVQAHWASSARAQYRRPNFSLLSGMCRCGQCGITLRSAVQRDVRVYVCRIAPGQVCSRRTSVMALPVEDIITEAVFQRLDTPELAAAIAATTVDEKATAALTAQARSAHDQLDELAKLYGAQRITQREWMTARRSTAELLAHTDRRLGHLTRSDALTGFIGNSTRLRNKWAQLDASRQASIIASVIDHVVIKPGTDRVFNPARVKPVWRR